MHIGNKLIKLERAYGGCLGIQSWRRTRPAAKSRGELLNKRRSADIRMGQPISVEHWYYVVKEVAM